MADVSPGGATVEVGSGQTVSVDTGQAAVSVDADRNVQVAGPADSVSVDTTASVSVEQPGATIEVVGPTVATGGGSIPPVTGNDGYALIEISSVAAFRVIKQSYIVAAFDITGFSGPATQEVGATVATPAFTASYNRTPDTATLTDSEGTPAKDVSSTPTSFSSNGTFQKTVNNQSVTFTLSATEDGDPELEEPQPDCQRAADQSAQIGNECHQTRDETHHQTELQPDDH